ncbi:MAG: DUF4838 domain-containing protein, partial [Armatimonadetes bacterium]|nr:DUF4838 domain-containing protein [Armatimonadota bacterium]
MGELTICVLNSKPAARFAARELSRYLGRMTGAAVTVAHEKQHDPARDALWLGLLKDFGRQPTVAEPRWDDEILLDVGPRGGIVAGSNPRSILLAAYRYLTELGCRWLRPGKAGELIPTIAGPLPEVHIHERPSYRYRGVCIEGAVSYEHVRDMIDWLPKVGMNTYFIQFREAYNFFQRWYSHEYNPLMPSQPFSLEEARTLTTRLRREIRRRGLALHMVGHGWTCEPFGIPGTGWYQHEGPLPPEIIPHLAEINGRRELFGGIALNTNLCYGNPETRRIVTDAVVEYARANPDVDVIHFWLADGSNNQCECPLCRDYRPSDLYVLMLNEIDEKLRKARLKTRIVFLAYVDLLWPPEREKIKNRKRFILMFAPITRSYSVSFTAAQPADTELPPYVRNRLQFPRDPATNLAFLRGWRKVFRGDGFDFDYHFMWDHYYDPAGYQVAEVLHEDIRGLRDIALDGLISCQVQRVFFPTGYPMTVMARTLWNRDVSLDQIAQDYFSAAFGDKAQQVRDYLATLSNLFNPRFFRGELSEAEQKRTVRGWRKIGRVLREFAPTIREGLADPDPARVAAWKLLREHATFCRLLSRALIKRHTADEQQARRAALKLVDWLRRRERRLHPVFDL